MIELKVLTKKHKNTIIDLAVFLFIGMLSITWFRGDFFIKFDDSFFSLNPLDDFYRGTYIWEHVYSTGLPYPKTALIPYWLFTIFLGNLGLSLVASQKLLYYLLFTLSGLSMYYLSATVLKNRDKDRRIACITSGLFYMMNPYTLINVWGRQTLVLFTYPILPLILALFIKGLNQKKSFRYVALICLLSVLFAPAFANLCVLVIFGMLFLYLFFFLLLNRKKPVVYKSLRFVALLMLFMFLINLWWILPYIPTIKPQFEASMIYSPFLETFMGASSRSSVMNSMRLLGWHLFDTYYYADPLFVWQGTYSTQPFILIGFLIPLLAYASIFWGNKNKHVIFFVFLSILSLFIVKGYNPPLKDINLWLLTHIPYASVFRIPYDKFGIILTLSYAFLIGFTASRFYGIAKRKIDNLSTRKSENRKLFSILYRKVLKFAPSFLLILLLILMEGIYAYPHWSGDVIHPGGKSMPSQRIHVPLYYYDAATWMSSQNEEFKILKLPPAIGGASVYEWDYGYACGDPLDQYFFVGHPLLGQKWGHSLADRLEDQLSYFIANPPLNYTNLSQVLGLFNIKYVLIHSDWKEGIYLYVPPPQHFVDILDKASDVHLTGEFGRLKIYEVNNYVPLIYATNNVAYIEDQFSLTSLYYLMSVEGCDTSSRPIFIFSEDNKENAFLNIAKDIIISLPSTSTGSASYKLYVPAEGKYMIYVSGDWLPLGEKIRFLIDNKSFEATSNNSGDSKLMLLGTVELDVGFHDLTVEVPSPTVHFSDTFTEYSNYTWQPLAGEWVRENGTLRQLNYIDNSWNIVRGLDLTSFTMEFNMKPEDSNLYGNGMIFHYFNGSTYALQLNEQPKTAELWYWDGSEWSRLTSSPVDIQVQRWYNIKVVVENNNVKTFINESKIIDFTDQDTSHNNHGFVGLDSGFKASFDNVTIRNSSGKTIFKDDFESPFVWSTFFGNWKIVDGWISSGDVDDSYLLLNSNFTNFMLEAKMAIKEQDRNNLAYPGIVFRVQDQYNLYGVFLRRTPNGGMPTIELWKRINGTWTFIAGRDLPKVDLNTTYTLRLIVLGWKIKVFLDDNQVIPTMGWIELMDHELPEGGIGLRSRYTDVYFDDITVTDIPPLINNIFIHELNPDIGLSPTLMFHKVNPTKYIVNITNATKTFFLAFVESYDDGWKAFINGKEQIPDEYHFVANGFANAWYVNQTGNFTINLEYIPQRLFEIGLMISIPTIAILSALIFVREHKLVKIQEPYYLGGKCG